MRQWIVGGCFLVMSGGIHAEYLRIEQAFGGMECASCTQFVQSRLAKRPGVESVSMDEKTGSLVVVLKPGNSLRLRQVTDLVQQSGFTPKDTRVVAQGVVADGVLKVSEAESLRLTGAALADGKSGEPIKVQGIIRKMPSTEGPGTLEIGDSKPNK